ncbi:MAG TPA: hypothetical protein VMF61_15215, partial [Candidatus Acidoferrales bacterium]|nr:hypothetical protein [Candidatus Acidoferrales bacterium]
MTGTSAAALIGLTFVVITVTVAAIRSDANPTHDGISTFTTPIVVHFGTALLTSAIFCAPWWSPRPPATIAGFLGLIGIVYSLRVALRARRLDS